MKKSILIASIIIIFLVLVGIGIAAFLKFSSEDAWLCQNGLWIKHGNPSTPRPHTECLANSNNSVNNNTNQNNANLNANSNINQTVTPEVKVDTPLVNAEVTSPLTITGQAKGWYFEAVFPVKLLDATGKEIAQGQAKAQGDWMTDQFVPFKAELTFTIDKDQNGTLVLKNDNPSGLPELQQELDIPIKLKAETMAIKVFFGNNKKDPQVLDCQNVFAIERKIAKTTATAKAALEELLKGPTSEETGQGYFTSINPGVKINKISIKDGTAYADFDQTLQQGVGGSCRVSGISAQISQTLKQFSSVQNVVISVNGKTEDILQP